MRFHNLTKLFTLLLIVFCGKQAPAQIKAMKPVLPAYHSFEGCYVVTGDTFFFLLNVTPTDYEITKVNLLMDGASYETIKRSGSSFAARIPMLDKAQGNYRVIYTATDFGGSTKTDSIMVRYDFKPRLNIVYPRKYEAGEKIRIKMTCTDSPAGNCAIKVYRSNILLFTAQNSIDTTIEFTLMYSKDEVSFVGVDSVGLKDSVYRVVQKFSHPELIPVDTFDLKITGISQYYIKGLYDTVIPDVPYICNRKTREMIRVDSATVVSYDWPFILMKKTIGKKTHLLLNSNGRVDTISDSIDGGFVSSSEKFVAFSDKDGLQRYNIQNREKLVIADFAASFSAVSDDGHVFFTDRTSRICHFNGDTVSVLDDRSLSRWFIYTNGRYVTWGREGELAVYDHKTVSLIPSNPKKVMMRDSIVAFDNFSPSGIRQVWIRTPDAEISQVTGLTSTHSFLIDLSPDRYLITTRSDGLYLENPNHEAKKLFGPDIFRHIGWYGDNFYASHYGILYKVDTTFQATSLCAGQHTQPAIRPSVSIEKGQLKIAGLNKQEKVLQYRITDLLGHRIKNHSPSNGWHNGSMFEVGGIASGIYLIELRTSMHNYLFTVPIQESVRNP
ncbi:MAG TPA: hypothetical protein VHO70_04850 [Chitinispirillaceae bacterium]|nr:hypothetical protein [Chitinispirillaceae bacterium]